MKRLIVHTALVTGMMLAAPQAYAGPDNRDVVHDERGNVVVNSFGNCVRTKWMGPSDECGKTVAQKVVKRTTVAEAERTLYFGFNKSTLTDESRAKLNSIANTLKSAEDVKEARIVGYADRIGSTSYNEKLSKKRAETVKNYLTSRGYLNSSVAETRWFGESVPATSCSNDLPRPELIECLQKDRRVELEIEYLPESGAR